MKSRRTVSFALVIVVLAAGLAGCLGSKNLPQGMAGLSTEPFMAYSDYTGYTAERSQPAAVTEHSQPAGASAKPSTTAVRPKTTEAAAAPAVPIEAAPQPPKTGAAFFDDAVFVGDSVTVGLKNTATAQRNAGKNYLGKAKFLASGSLSYSNCTLALTNPRAVHPKIKGKKVYIEDGVKQLGAKKVFIMLGMNDFAAYDNNKVIQSATALVGRILQKSPGVQIYIESVTPITAGKQHGRFNNKNVDAFNQKLQAMCETNGWTYVDINSRFKDESGSLNPAYCGDPNGMGIHMAKKGCDKWAEYLTSTFTS